MLQSTEEHYAERLLAEALDTYPGGRPVGVAVATKGGMQRTGESAKGWAPRRLTPEALKSLVRQQRDILVGEGGKLALWQFHHTDGYDTREPPSKVRNSA